MKISIERSAKLALAPILAIGVTGSLAAAQLASVEVLALLDDTQAPQGEMISASEISPGEDVGWVVNGYFRDPTRTVAALYGSFGPSDPLGPRVLREAGTFAGITQFDFRQVKLASGRLAYITPESSGGERTAWIDDTPIASVGGPAGNTGSTWRTIRDVHLATDGTAVLFGRLERDPFGVPTLIEYPSGNVLLGPGVPVPGTTETVDTIDSFDRSSDGSHYAVATTLAPSGDQAILVDGSIYELAFGVEAREGIEAGSVFEQFGETRSWTDFRRPTVNNAGAVAFSASAMGIGNVAHAVFRDGRRQTVPDRVSTVSVEPELDERGLVLYPRDPLGILFAAYESELVVNSARSIDMDGDGLAEPSLQIASFPLFSTSVAVDGTGGIYGLISIVDGSTSAGPQAVVRSLFVQPDTLVCSGVVNSTGRPAQLLAYGSSVVALDEMRLLATNLPSSSFALPLYSLTQGFAANPGGSDGNVCLGGSIGRAQFQTMFIPFSGQGSADVFLDLLPQPNGPQAGLPGETWYIQLWYRDVQSATNFSDAISLTLR